MPAAHVEGLYSCLDYYQDVGDPFSKELLARYDELFPGSAKFTAGSACSGMYRGLKLWEAAVTEAGSLDQDDVIDALDHAKIPRGPGGPAEMVPGQHHVRMNMYIAQAKDGAFKVVEEPGGHRPQGERGTRGLRLSEIRGPATVAGPRSGHHGTTFEPSGPWGLASSRRVAVAAASRPKQKRVSAGRAVRR